MKRGIYSISCLLLFLFSISCCNNYDVKPKKSDLEEVVRAILKSELVYYEIKSNYPELLKKEAVFLRSEKINNLNFDSTQFLMKPVQLKTSDELLEYNNPNFYYFFDIKISQDLARVVVVYSFAPVITVYLEKDKGDWKETDCVIRHRVLLKPHAERDLISEIIGNGQRQD